MYKIGNCMQCDEASTYMYKTDSSCMQCGKASTHMYKLNVRKHVPYVQDW